MVRRRMPARDMFVRPVWRIDSVGASEIPIALNATASMLWARTRLMCSSGSSVRGRARGMGCRARPGSAGLSCGTGLVHGVLAARPGTVVGWVICSK